jgi:uncharacterized protein (DUF983 family)
MFARKQQAAMLDIGAGTTLIIVGIIGALARLGVFDDNRLPHWSAVEHWWPLLVIIAGLIMWLSDMEEIQKTRQSQHNLEAPYGD